MKRFTVLLVACLLFASIASAHDGYHYIGLAGTSNQTDRITVWMNMVEKPNGCKVPCHVRAWTILWDVYGTGQFLEAGVGYDPDESKKSMILWYGSPKKKYGKTVSKIPFNTWVEVSIVKLLNEPRGVVTWRWEDEDGWQEITKSVKLKDWLGNQGYHPTKLEIVGDHPTNVHVAFAGIPTFSGDAYWWHVEGNGPWQPYGTFETFTVQ